MSTYCKEYSIISLTVSPETSYENLRLAGFICTMLKIPSKFFLRSLHNCNNPIFWELKPIHADVKTLMKF